MAKTIIIALIVILILGAVIFFGITGAVLPWFVARSDQHIATVKSPALTQVASATWPVTTMPTREPADMTSYPSPIIAQLDTTPVCFASEAPIPFSFKSEADLLFVRTGSGVQIFKLKTGELVDFVHSSQNVFAAALSPDGQVLAWSLQDGTIQLVHLSDQKILATLTGHPDPANDLLFSPTGDRLYSASHDGLVRIWDLSGKQIGSIKAGSGVLGMGLSMDGTKLATIPFDGPVSLWNLAGNTKIAEFASSGGYDTSDAHFSPDGQYLAADLATGIYLWRVSDSSLVWNKVKNSMAVAFSPDGQYFAYSDIDDGNKVFLNSLDGLRVIRTITGIQSPVGELFFSPDGSLLAAADGTEIHIWQVEDGRLLFIGKATCP